MADATYHFLSHVRCGFAASITQPDAFGSAQPAAAIVGHQRDLGIAQQRGNFRLLRNERQIAGIDLDHRE